MTTEHTLGSTLGASMAADVLTLVRGEASIALTIGGVSVRAIPIEYFGLVEDPRALELMIATADLPVNQHGKVVVIGADTYTLEGVRPVGPNLSRILLRDE